MNQNGFCVISELKNERQHYDNNQHLVNWIEFNRFQDHSGLELTFGFFAYTITLSVYDNRHWDYNKQKWEE